MWAHQYNQEPNQVECSLHNKPWTTDGPESNLYGLEPNFGCCTANFHQGWPKLTSSLWMASHDNGLAAMAYAPCEVRSVIGGVEVHIAEETDYPFRGRIELKVSPASAATFPLHLRIPVWAQQARLTVNGSVIEAAPGTFAKIEREWKPVDRVTLDMPLEVRAKRGFNNSVSLYRGPLVFSLDIGQDWLKLRDRGMTADWQVYPTTQWNYALDAEDLQAVRITEGDVGSGPFTAKGSPTNLEVKGRKLPTWHAVDGVADTVPRSPVAEEALPSGAAADTLILVPYAAAKLRITAFPVLPG
jgi:hypothetical protein